MTVPDQYLFWALKQAGDPYVMGAEAQLSQSDPTRFDCSELVEWSCGKAGVRPTMPDGAWGQYQHCKAHGTLIPVAHGIRTRGALLIVAKGALRGNGGGNHIGFSLGDGRTIEARGRKYGVGSFNANGRNWTHAALVPGVDYITPHTPAAPPPPPQQVDWGAVRRLTAAQLLPYAQAMPDLPGIAGGQVNFHTAILQKALNLCLNGSRLAEHGVYDDPTTLTVLAYQRTYGISGDFPGACGPFTRYALCTRIDAIRNGG